MAEAAARRTVLVTGAGRGIGRSSALAFARAGFDVAVNFSRSESAARAVAEEAERAGDHGMRTIGPDHNGSAHRRLPASVAKRDGHPLAMPLDA